METECDIVEQVEEKIFRIKVSLPDNPLRSLNSYLILGSDRNLLIDTGFYETGTQ